MKTDAEYAKEYLIKYYKAKEENTHLKELYRILRNKNIALSNENAELHKKIKEGDCHIKWEGKGEI